MPRGRRRERAAEVAAAAAETGGNNPASGLIAEVENLQNSVSSKFHVATFYSEGPPHDKGLSLHRSYELLKAAFEPWCASFNGYSVRRVRSLQLADGTPGHMYAREFSKVSGHLNYPNTGYNTIGFGAFKPFIVLHMLERMAAGDYLYFSDCNVLKHWNLQAFPNLAFDTTRWLLDAYGHEDVAMPRENPSTIHKHICSAKALDAAERDCGGKDLASISSPHSNRIAVRNTQSAAGLMRLWLNATHDDNLYLPSPTRPGGRWHSACRYARMPRVAMLLRV